MTLCKCQNGGGFGALLTDFGRATDALTCSGATAGRWTGLPPRKKGHPGWDDKKFYEEEVRWSAPKLPLDVYRSPPTIFGVSMEPKKRRRDTRFRAGLPPGVDRLHARRVDRSGASRQCGMLDHRLPAMLIGGNGSAQDVHADLDCRSDRPDFARLAVARRITLMGSAVDRFRRRSESGAACSLAGI